METPMLKQYWQIKSEIKDDNTILFFRLGDFYEMFFDDAKIASEILDITLTSRNKNNPDPVPLCGVPFHAAEGYIAKLLSAGKKVAICEQVEDPKTAKGVVRREVVKIITPGVLMEADSLIASRNNYLAAIAFNKQVFSLAICDASTGDFRATVIKDIYHLAEELSRIEPREVLVARSFSEDKVFGDLKQILNHAVISVLDDPYFDPAECRQIISENVPSDAYSAVGAVVGYLKSTRKTNLNHIRTVKPYSISEYMVVDETTKRNLELAKTLADGSHHGSLVWLLDKTRTAMGARTVRNWIFYPLQSIGAINERLDAVEALKDDFKLAEYLKNDLSVVSDIERITARVVTGGSNARELVSLKDSLRILPKIKGHLKDRTGYIGRIRDEINPLTELAERIDKVLLDDAPLSIKDGGLIKCGFSAELDELRGLSTSGKDFIARLEATERQRTGINSLKVRYNKVFGYYIEVTHTHAEKIPNNYIRKQTLVNAERFITPELKEYEEKVLGAEERIRQLEYELFSELRNFASSFARQLANTSAGIGRLDAVLSLAESANKNRYCRPSFLENGRINITGGRHPVIEALNPASRFVPNDINLDMDKCRVMIITGPNMAGKSTVMRQTALISLMAQMGSFVPAAEAELSVVDRIFTRVGASDNLLKGQSTFMVEMNETAQILKNATEKSLILIDEIGRGTSTYDGVSIAWAVAEYLHDSVKAKTLFATHYHELTDLSLTKSAVKNFNVAVKEWNDQIIFLRKLVEGGVNRSYGIQVARLAGLPQDIIARAKEILVKLEEGEAILKNDNSAQMPLFGNKDNAKRCGDTSPDEIAEIIKKVDTSVMTPIEALNLIHELKQKIL
ncbi:MAG: DNA mismatch repair protein MutS [Deltaproteobacteria bacterium]|nr:DNA mismatch repair protein MutS [Deltaproteobacteria bacterium]